MKTKDPSIRRFHEMFLARVAFADDDFRGTTIAVRVELSLRVKGRKESEEAKEIKRRKRSANRGLEEDRRSVAAARREAALSCPSTATGTILGPRNI